MCFGAFFYFTGIRREWLLQLLIVILSTLSVCCSWYVFGLLWRKRRDLRCTPKSVSCKPLTPGIFKAKGNLFVLKKKSKLCPKRDWSGSGSLDLQRYGSKTDREIGAVVILRAIKTLHWSASHASRVMLGLPSCADPYLKAPSQAPHFRPSAWDPPISGPMQAL